MEPYKLLVLLVLLVQLNYKLSEYKGILLYQKPYQKLYQKELFRLCQNSHGKVAVEPWPIPQISVNRAAPPRHSNEAGEVPFDPSHVSRRNRPATTRRQPGATIALLTT